MLDCSRNAVMRPDKVKEFAGIIADMGYNMLMLYTEDTYEIKGEPFFGHMRGRYTEKELKDIDAHCQSIGVELVPCIQTLAHLSQLKQWERFSTLFDCNDILMAGEPEVYELIEKMFETLSKSFTSRRVHVGMDEAFLVGRGCYQDKNGYVDRVEILIEHLKRVKMIADKYGFQMMIWSDMFIRLHNDGEYYGENIQIPQKTIELVPEGIELVYWDYYFKDKEHYDAMFNAHAHFKNTICFAGGLWTWTGYVPNMSKTWDTLVPAMKSVQEQEIDTLFFTLWGDNGKECSFYTQLPMIFAAAKMEQGIFDKKSIEKEFQEKYGYAFEEFMNLELPNLVDDRTGIINNPGKYLLFNDPFIGILDFTVPAGVHKRYREASDKLSQCINGRRYDYIFDAEKKLSDVLIWKADLGIRIRSAYQSQDVNVLEDIAKQEIPMIIKGLQAFAEAFRILWLKENKPFGLEVQEARFGALMYRLKKCAERLMAYVKGEVAQIEELEEETLVACKDFELQNEWKSMITTCVN